MTKAKFDPENPPIDFKTARFAKGRGPEGLANARKAIETARGRPRKGAKAAGSSSRSLRLPDATWADIEALAKSRKHSVHKMLRIMVAEYLYTETWNEKLAQSKRTLKEPKKARKKAAKTRAA